MGGAQAPLGMVRVGRPQIDAAALILDENTFLTSWAHCSPAPTNEYSQNSLRVGNQVVIRVNSLTAVRVVHLDHILRSSEI